MFTTNLALIVSMAFFIISEYQGRSQDFSQGEGDVKLCQSEGTHQIVMSFSPPVVGCLVKIGLQKGGTHGHHRTPSPSYAPTDVAGIVHLVIACRMLGSVVGHG